MDDLQDRLNKAVIGVGGNPDALWGSKFALLDTASGGLKGGDLVCLSDPNICSRQVARAARAVDEVLRPEGWRMKFRHKEKDQRWLHVWRRERG